MNNLNNICNLLTSHDNFLVLMHASPDGDTIGSATALCAALQQMGKKAKYLCADAIDNKYQYMLAVVEAQQFEHEFIVSVDIADTKLLGSLCDEYSDQIDINIDHHQSNKLYAKYNFVNAGSGANCENIYAIIKALGVKIDRNIAACLYTGIATDTGCFKYTNTTAGTLRIAADLLESGAPAGDINRAMFESKSRARIEVERQVLDTIEFHCDGQVALIVITEQMQRQTSPADLEGITAIPRTIEGVMIGLTIKEKGEENYKISVRTFEPVDASKICSVLGGGGHSAAAGYETTGPLEEVKAKLLRVCRKELEH